MKKTCTHITGDTLAPLLIQHIFIIGSLTIKSAMDELEILANQKNISDRDRVIITTLSSEVAHIFNILEPLFAITNNVGKMDEITASMNKAYELHQLAKEQKIIPEKCPCEPCKEIKRILEETHPDGECK